jgi:hypothetical protein
MSIQAEAYRYDVVTVIARAEGESIELLRGFFDDTVFLRGRFFNKE